MIEFIVIIILIIAFAFLLYPIVTIPIFFINVSLFVIIALRAKTDLKENKMHVYYLWAAFLIAIMFAAREYGFLSRLFIFLFNNRILYYTQAVIFIFILAHLIGFTDHSIKSFKKDLKSRKSV